MTRHSLPAWAFLVAAAVASPRVAHTQAFKVARFNIGGDGGTDYLTAEPGTGRVFVSRGTHVMVVDGATGTVLGDIPDTPRTHGIALAPTSHHGFITNGGDSSVTLFDLRSLAVIKKIPVRTGGLDGIMYEDFSDRIILTNHSRPIGTAVAIDAKSGDIVGSAELEDNSPEGAASDGKGRIFVNNEGKNTIQVIDVKAMRVLASWPLAPCEGPTGIAYDRGTNRIFSGCGKTSVVVDATSGTGEPSSRGPRDRGVVFRDQPLSGSRGMKRPAPTRRAGGGRWRSSLPRRAPAPSALRPASRPRRMQRPTAAGRATPRRT